MEFYFSHPYNLFFLSAAALVAIIHFFSIKYGKKKAVSFANFEAIERVAGSELFSKNITLLYLSILIVVIISLALSGAGVSLVRETSKFSFVIAVDASSSMTANDLLPDRISAAKEAAIEFVNNLPPSSRLGVISFSGSSLIKQRVTDNRMDMKAAVSSIKINEIGGTDILDAVITASNLLEKEDSKAVILISDGQININSVQQAIDYSNENNVIIQAIGIGTRQGSITQLNTISKLDEDSLKAIAFNTNGKYFSATNLNELRDSFNQIIEKTNKKVQVDLTYYLLVFGLFVFLVEWFLASTRYRNLP
jgi:Ca-activated chloride channel family protein